MCDWPLEQKYKHRPAPEVRMEKKQLKQPPWGRDCDMLQNQSGQHKARTYTQFSYLYLQVILLVVECQVSGSKDGTQWVEDFLTSKNAQVWSSTSQTKYNSACFKHLVIPALGRWKQDDQTFKVILGLHH